MKAELCFCKLLIYKTDSLMYNLTFLMILMKLLNDLYLSWRLFWYIIVALQYPEMDINDFLWNNAWRIVSGWNIMNDYIYDNLEVCLCRWWKISQGEITKIYDIEFQKKIGFERFLNESCFRQVICKNEVPLL